MDKWFKDKILYIIIKYNIMLNSSKSENKTVHINMKKMLENFDNLIPSILSFTEVVDVKACKYLLTLDETTFKNEFWEEGELNESGEKWKFEPYYKRIQEYCIDAIKNNGKFTMNYKTSNNKNGRIYTKTMGLQGFQFRVRGLLTRDIYKDYDMVNAHPSILLYVTNKYKIRNSMLTDYVNNRSEILEKENLTKRDILMMMNQDKPKKSKSNWVNSFQDEMKEIKLKLGERYKDITTSNTKNPKSSIMNKVLCIFENTIIMKVLKHHKTEIIVPMFDGFLIQKDTKLTADWLNDYTSKIGIKWTEKSINNDINIPDDFDEEGTIPIYDLMKVEFEKHHFHIMQPPVYAMMLKNQEGEVTPQLFNKYDFSNNTADWIDKDGKNFVGEWVKDTKHRKYNGLAFQPYAKNTADKSPKEYYNTFLPFTAEPIKSDKCDISNFNRLINSLCGQDEACADYLLKYIADIFQNPSILPERAIIIKGEEGCGKDTLLDIIMKLMGRNYCHRTEDMNTVFGEFNEAIQDKIIVQFNEIEGKDAKKYEQKIKGLITKKDMYINIKGIRQFTHRNQLRAFFFSNGKTPIQVQAGSRRWFIVKCDGELINCVDFFDNLYDVDMENQEWINTLMHYLMNIDLSNFKIKNPPQSKEHHNLKSTNIKPIYQFLIYLRDNQEESNEVFKHRQLENDFICTPSEFYSNYKNYLTEFKLKCIEDNLDIKTMTKDLLEIGINKKKIQINKFRTLYFIFDMKSVNKKLDKFDVEESE
jgi:hypothetical protein